MGIQGIGALFPDDWQERVEETVSRMEENPLLEPENVVKVLKDNIRMAVEDLKTESKEEGDV